MKSSWEIKWIEDIDFLRDNLIENHKNLFFYCKEELFDERINNLKSIVSSLDYDEIKIELSKIVSLIGDAHTTITYPANKFLPFKFYLFEDGIYMVRVTKEYKELLYKKIDLIEDIKIDEVLRRLETIIPHENKQYFKGKAVKYIGVAEVLYGLLIIDDMDFINLTIEGEEYRIQTFPLKKINYIYEDKLPLYAKKATENLWYEYLIESKELYIKYNSCRENSTISIGEKIKEIINIIEVENIKKLRIDLRHNLGGDSRLITPLINYIKSNDDINKKENLTIIIGRETFSSGLLNAYEFRNETNANFVGEATGGKPNCYGEILKFTLPNSKFIVSYSTKYYKLIEDDNIMYLEPDQLLLESIDDYKRLKI